MTKVELFEAIRKAYFIKKDSIRCISKEHNIHRRTVREAIESAIPPERKSGSARGIVLTSYMKEKIDEWLIGDRTAPKKQRHTAKRIYSRLVHEEGFCGAEPTIKKYVGRRRRELGLCKKAFVPQVHLAGEEAEVDWYEAYVDFPCGRQKAFCFQMRACCSGKEFHMAFPCQTQQAFFEGHVAAFYYFGGIFKRIRYDNLTSAVKKVLCGRRRVETERFIVLRSHYLFEAIFCLPGKEGAHEKGGVEGAVGRFRRSHFVPVPTFKDFTALNKHLIEACQEDDNRTIVGKQTTIREDWKKECSELLPLPKEPFNCDEVYNPQVNKKGLVTIKMNQYSVPIRLVGCRIEARISSSFIKCNYQGNCVSEHERLHGKHKISALLDHYLELLRHKPGAFTGSLPLAQAKQKGQWHKSYDVLWMALKDRLGQTSGTLALIEILFLHRQYPLQEVNNAIQLALDTQFGVVDVSVVERLIKEHRGEVVSTVPLATHKGLKGYDRPQSSTKMYDCLLFTFSENNRRIH